MTILLDTHLLLWAAEKDPRLPALASEMIRSAESKMVFSSVNIWEVVIKRSLGRGDFGVDPHRLRSRLLESGYSELSVSSEHALAVGNLPSIHKDPFDRILIAQAVTERLTLVTSDQIVANYPGPIVKV